jgi:hypothetical protein
VEWVDGTGGAEFDLLVPVAGWLAGCSGVQQQAELKTRPFQFSPRMPPVGLAEDSLPVSILFHHAPRFLHQMLSFFSSPSSF